MVFECSHIIIIIISGDGRAGLESGVGQREGKTKKRRRARSGSIRVVVAVKESRMKPEEERRHMRVKCLLG